MSRFIQLHMLTAYPPANLNRDDQGSPKTAKMGGYDRLRVSSQCLKRAWRTSDMFSDVLIGTKGQRTKLFGLEVYKTIIRKGEVHENAVEWATAIASIFGKNRKVLPDSELRKILTDEKKRQEFESKLRKRWASRSCEGFDFNSLSVEDLNKMEGVEIEQLAFITQEEQEAIRKLLQLLVECGRAPTQIELDVLRDKTQSVDVALWGRMLADSPHKNIEAACQVAHAISVHPVIIEDDYFTAIDDLNSGLEDMGAAHIGETRFAAGLFYTYVCINRELLIKNLDGDLQLAARAIRALTEAAVKVAPEGKQNSFASRAYASYVLAEKGDQQPRSLSVAYLKPINHRDNEDFISDAIKALIQQKDSFDEVYDTCADRRFELNVLKRQGTMAGLLDFVS
ncbi:type I-E CRISPR-associated protein Cas7/Cse4/CasC [Methylobacter sp. Wu1]|uniref:type I-E CRISPR-associated protein Cas7/Cse4/CasC n=1 Tax=Methylobacter sp. Wu1 TaxID=3119359 RepID=UPI002F957D44